MERVIEVAWESTNALMPLVFWFFAHKECHAQRICASATSIDLPACTSRHQVAVCVEPFLTEFFVKARPPHCLTALHEEHKSSTGG